MNAAVNRPKDESTPAAADKQHPVTQPLDKFAQARQAKKVQKRKRHRARLRKPNAKG